MNLFKQQFTFEFNYDGIETISFVILKLLSPLISPLITALLLIFNSLSFLQSQTQTPPLPTSWTSPPLLVIALYCQRHNSLCGGRSSCSHSHCSLQCPSDQIRHGTSSDLVWDVEGMCDMQKEVIATLFDPNTSNNIIAVFPTGSGKFHIIRVVGTMHG